jgi:hypothetical protein
MGEPRHLSAPQPADPLAHLTDAGRPDAELVKAETDEQGEHHRIGRSLAAQLDGDAGRVGGGDAAGNGTQHEWVMGLRRVGGKPVGTERGRS